ncbi:hypothetical protein RHRU231_450106 [Rhodococcus ruber]|uniref:Uncharacterized protein n=1 Tax=Rhodococcus ruber TaxID=1830 RepID=A0A098BJL5_9NOCA|nr:hypothetical protein RHRU231_450106 [Rhodococcus ruber]
MFLVATSHLLSEERVEDVGAVIVFEALLEVLGCGDVEGDEEVFVDGDGHAVAFRSRASFAAWLAARCLARRARTLLRLQVLQVPTRCPDLTVDQ